MRRDLGGSFLRARKSAVESRSFNGLRFWSYEERSPISNLDRLKTGVLRARYGLKCREDPPWNVGVKHCGRHGPDSATAACCWCIQSCRLTSWVDSSRYSVASRACSRATSERVNGLCVAITSGRWAGACICSGGGVGNGSAIIFVPQHAETIRDNASTIIDLSNIDGNLFDQGVAFDTNLTNAVDVLRRHLCGDLGLMLLYVRYLHDLLSVSELTLVLLMRSALYPARAVQRNAQHNKNGYAIRHRDKRCEAQGGGPLLT